MATCCSAETSPLSSSCSVRHRGLHPFMQSVNGVHVKFVISHSPADPGLTVVLKSSGVREWNRKCELKNK